MRRLTNFYDFRSKWTATTAIGIQPTKPLLSQQVNFKYTICILEERYAIKFCFKLGKKCHAIKAWSTAMTQRPRDRVPCWSMLALPDPRMADRANPPTKIWWSFFLQHWHDLHALGLHGTDSRQGNYVEVLREFRKWFRRKRPALFKSGQWHFHQANALVHNSILVTYYLTKMGIKTVPQPPYSPNLAPCDFRLFPKLRGCRYETNEEMREAVKKVIDTRIQKDFDGAFQKLLYRYNKSIAAGGDYFGGG